MGNDFKIKVKIGDRLYPMNIQPHQEEGCRRAAKKINEMIQNFESTYEVQDKRDPLAMCAITLAMQIEQAKLNENQVDSTVKDKLESINQLISSML